MKRFALYARTSTEDHQSPADSLGWQRARAEALVLGHGKIVATFHDVGQSRTIPWKRRPKATELLHLFADARRGFDAVVVGEPQRAFAGNEFGLVFPLFQHHGIELWVPEIGGRVDPGSEAHDLVMTLFGGMSKGERSRIKIRVRTAMLDQAQREGRFLGGRPPYGYRLVDAGPHPKGNKAQRGQRLHQLEPDSTTAPIVRRIFKEYLAGRGLLDVAEGLTRDGIPSPSGADPERNAHRATSKGAWSKSAIRAILRNPKYTGRQVWNRQRRDEVLVDPNDVSMGHQSRMRWNDRSAWVWSAHQTHKPIVASKTFAAAQELMSARATVAPRRPRKAQAGRVYLLRGILHCGICGRRMESHWHKESPWYRCRYPSEYAATNGLEHPRNAYLRESALVPLLDDWLGGLFDPKNVDETCRLLAEHSADSELEARVDRARRALAEVEQKLARYRATLDAGGDPIIVARWIKDVEAQRLAAEAEVLLYDRTTGSVTPAEVRKMIRQVGNVRKLIAKATRVQKATMYGDLGVKLLYEPTERRVLAEAWPGRGLGRVGGGI